MSPVSTFPAQPREPQGSPPVVEVQKQTLLDYLDATSLSHELTEAEKTQFVSVCQAFGLSPWKREVYATVYGEGSFRRFSVITGYEVYLKRAERTGRLNGWSSRVEGEGDQMRAIVTIHRKDWSEPLIHEVFFSEAVQRKKDGSLTAFWSKMPRFQLKKVCISQAFRLCFPDELGGLPFDAAELPDAETLAAPVIPSIVHLAPEGKAVPVPQSSPESSSANLADAALTAPELPKDSGGLPSQGDDGSSPETVQSLQDHLTAFLDEHYTAFTEKHRDWILNTAWKARDIEGVRKMIRYAEKVVRNGTAVAGATA